MVPPTEREVHIWRASLGLSLESLQDLRAHLDKSELERASAFQDEKFRHRFIASRGILRSLLGAYLMCSPRDLRFDYGPRGKPFLSADRSHSGLHFNLTHSGDQALYAFALGREVGVDLEKVDPKRDMDGISRRYFSPGERRVLTAAEPDHRLNLFFQCWTLKEAYLKGHGDGLAASPSQFEVAFGPGADPALRSVAWDPQEPGRWTLSHLEAEAGYKASLAVAGGEFELVDRTWQEE